MTCRMKLPLTILGILASCGLVACSSSPTGNTGVITPNDDSGSPAASNDSGTPANNDSGSSGGGDSGGAGGDSGGSSCTLPSAWSMNPACDSCQTQYCCASINKCAADPGCTAIYNCQVNCYSGVGIDGGTISQDGGLVDDAGDTVEDLCAQACLAAGTTAAQALFNPQDQCVNVTSCSSACD